VKEGQFQEANSNLLGSIKGITTGSQVAAAGIPEIQYQNKSPANDLAGLSTY